jgi:hypothetical protein
MRHVRTALALVVLLIAAQQGAIVHELSHSSVHPGAIIHSGADLHMDAGSTAEGSCALCPAFAQAITTAFSHSFGIPPLIRARAERSAEPPIAAADAAIPTPRSRGPPS